MTDNAFTRRRLVAGAVATGAAVAVPDTALARRPARPRRRRRADVVVVGAGFAGLTAAREIARAGRSVVVLEARGRVGGRALNHDLGNGRISEGGATFVGPTQDRVVELARQVGIRTFKTFNTGENVYLRDGGRLEYADTGPTGSAPPDPLILPELAKVVTQVNEMSRGVPVDAPWEAAHAARYDSQTLQTFIEENSLTDEFRSLVTVATRPLFGAEPREVSMLFTLFFVAACGDERTPGTFDRALNTRNGAQESRFEGGSSSVTAAVARELGRRVVLRTPVRRIEQTRGGVEVVSDRITVVAKRAIVAVPPVLAGRIDYRPGLPAARDALTQRLPQGQLLKAAAVYRRPFWRDKGLTGQAFCSETLVTATYDDSPEDGSLGVLFGFVGGDKLRQFSRLAPADRRAAVLGELVRFFGPEAGAPQDYFETDWTEQRWSRGCPMGIYGPGTMSQLGEHIRRPVGRIHWAGTETSTYWNGYMDGAVRSGLRAAKEVLER